MGKMMTAESLTRNTLSPSIAGMLNSEEPPSRHASPPVNFTLSAEV